MNQNKKKPTLSPESEREFNDLIKELFIGFCECGYHNVYLGDSDTEDILPLKQFIAKVEQRARNEGA